MSASPFAFPNMLRCALLLFALLWAGLMPSNARADLTYTTVTGSDGDGSLAATVSFTPVLGGIDITVTNTETGTFAKGQAISAVSFTLSNALSTPTFFTELKGVSFNPTAGGSWTLASGSAFDDTSSASPINAIDHWGFASPTGGSMGMGGTVSLATAKSPVPGSGNPHYMILPSSGTAASGNGALANGNFFPYIIGPADFFLTVTGVTPSTILTAAEFSGVNVFFGTSPDKMLGTTETGTGTTFQITAVPEPSTMTIVLSCCGLSFLAFRARERFSTRT